MRAVGELVILAVAAAAAAVAGQAVGRRVGSRRAPVAKPRDIPPTADIDDAVEVALPRLRR